VRATTKFVGVLLHADGAHDLAVLLIKEGIGTSLDRLAHAHVCNDDRHILANGAANLGLSLIAFISCE
jgi:hypothetical protein